MEQYEFYITDLQRVMRKRYKIVILTIILSLGFSVFFVKIKPPMYNTSATVKVDRNTVMGLGMEATIYGVWDNIETETKVLTSYPVLLRAAKRLGLISDTIPSDTYPSDENTLDILFSVRSGISTSLSGNTNIIKIEASSTEPKKSADLANAVALSYREFCRYGKKLHATNTKEFVENQLERCQKELADAESMVRLFEEQQQIPLINENSRNIIQKSLKIQDEFKMIDEANTIIDMQEKKLLDYRKTTNVMEKFAKLQQDIKTDSLLDSVSSLANMGWVSEFTDRDPGLQELNRRLIQLQIQMADQASFYKKGHPANKDIEKRIRETVDQILGEYQKKRAILADKNKKRLEEEKSIETDLRSIPTNQMQYERLIRRLKVNEEIYNLLSKKHQEAMITEAGIVDDVTIMSLAQTPKSPVNKNVSKAAFIGIIFGLILGLIFAILREVLDTSIGTIEEVERTIKLPVLAVIPHIQGEAPKKNHRLYNNKKTSTALVKPSSILVTQLNPKDPTSEAFRILRTNMEYILYEKPYKTILISSATMQEGKSTICANLAIVLAQQGKKVMLLGCNLRRPSMYKVFGLERGPGVSDILIEKAKWQECVKSVTDLILGGMAMEEVLNVPGLENLHFITYGQKPPNPVDLLASQKMDNLLESLRQNFDIVLIDAPPILPVADSIVLSKKVDGVFLVYKVGKVPRNSLRLSKERLDAVSANIMGVVLNDIKPETSGFPHASIYYQYKEHVKKEPIKKHA